MLTTKHDQRQEVLRIDVDVFSLQVSQSTNVDGLHFCEPVPGNTLVARDQELRWDCDHRDNKDRKNIVLLQRLVVNAAKQTLHEAFCERRTPGGFAITGLRFGRTRTGCARVIRRLDGRRIVGWSVYITKAWDVSSLTTFK